jgi:hypothetical protein
MRLARLVAVGLVLGTLAGFLVALIRPRSAPGAPVADTVGNHDRPRSATVDRPALRRRRRRTTVVHGGSRQADAGEVVRLGDTADVGNAVDCPEPALAHLAGAR